MDGLLVLLALIVLAIPVTIIVLLVGQSRLRSRVSLLEARIASLSTTDLAAQPAPAPPLPIVATPHDIAISEPPVVAGEPTCRHANSARTC